ncbi:ParB-like protein [soil metagenome]
MKSYKGLCFLVAGLLVLSHSGLAGDYAPYQPTLGKDAICEVKLSALHPTQFCVGEREVRARAEKLLGKKARKLDKYLDEHIMPLVIGPKGVPYIVDHHHLAKALQESKVRDSLPAQVLANYSNLDTEAFWKKMREQKWVYPYQRGAGPLSVATLPETLTQMTDDPYRSLVWAARHEGEEGDRDETPFADFKWADYFRGRIKLTGTEENFRQATLQAAAMMNQ